MTAKQDGSLSFYFFDLDDNLFFLPTRLYLWNSETREEREISSSQFAAIQSLIGKSGGWEDWATRDETYRDFRDRPDIAASEQQFSKDLLSAIATTNWQGPSWPLLVHASRNGRPVAFISARGHAPETVEAGFETLVSKGILPKRLSIVDIYTVTNPATRKKLKVDDPNTSIPSIKKLAIKAAVENALSLHGNQPPHRFGISDDDPNNVVLAITAMRDCKVKYPDKRFFVVNTNKDQYVKLEVFPMMHPVTADQQGEPLLSEVNEKTEQSNQLVHLSGGNASVYITDMDRAIEFYTNKLGFRLKTRIADEWAEVDAGEGFVIGLHPAHPPPSPQAGNSGAINIELNSTGNLDELVGNLKLRGVAFNEAIQDYPNVRLITCSDPDGNKLFLSEVLHSDP